MSKIRPLAALIASGVLAVIPPLLCADNQVVTARHVNNVQEKQAKSIVEGVKVGKLTPKEARKLRAEQKEINEMERSMRADGGLNSSELRVLFERLEHARNNINQLLRNNISTHRELDEAPITPVVPVIDESARISRF